MIAPARIDARSPARVLIVGDPAGVTNVELVAGWRALGIAAAVAAPLDARALAAPGDLFLGRIDVLQTVDGVRPGLLELLLLERSGARVLNGATSLLAAHDKLLTARLLGRAGLPHPRTVHVRPGEAPALDPPLVLKPRFGSWGLDVFRCESEAELHRCLDEIAGRPWFRRHGAILQELVPPVGHDLRVLVADDRVVGSIERRAAAGEWRTNAALGGSVHAGSPSPSSCALAVAAARALGGDLVGVDLLPCSGGPTIVEVNGAVDFDQRYALPGCSVWADTAAALGLLPLERAA